jgi:hypothetical protein
MGNAALQARGEQDATARLNRSRNWSGRSAKALNLAAFEPVLILHAASLLSWFLDFCVPGNDLINGDILSLETVECVGHDASWGNTQCGRNSY